MGISTWQLLIVAVIVFMLFGAGKLKNIGSDLGTAIRDFKKSVRQDPDSKDADFPTKK